MGISLKRKKRDFPSGPVVKTLPSNIGGLGLMPGWGAKIPHTSWPKNQNIKQKKCFNQFSKDFKMAHIKIVFLKKERRWESGGNLTRCPLVFLFWHPFTNSLIFFPLFNKCLLGPCYMPGTRYPRPCLLSPCLCWILQSIFILTLF